MKLIPSILYKLASPRLFYKYAGRLSAGFAVLSLMAFVYGLFGGLYLAPPDYQQGDAFRIIYIHVPCAFMSMCIYSLMTFCAMLTLIWKIKLADIVMKVSAPMGAMFSFLALLTGSLWGKPMWGTWWIWDARLTSELILFFLYVAAIALRSAYAERQQTASVLAIFVLVGFLDIPIIHYSVNWWNTLHQGASLSRFAVPSIAPSMLYPLLAMILAFFLYFISQLFRRARSEVLFSERRTEWVKQLLKNFR